MKVVVDAIYDKEIEYKDKKTGDMKKFTAYTVKSGDTYYKLWGFKGNEVKIGDILEGDVEEEKYTKKDGSAGIGYKLHKLSVESRLDALEKEVKYLKKIVIGEPDEEEEPEISDEDIPF
jgi:hypothetical protein